MRRDQTPTAKRRRLARQLAVNASKRAGCTGQERVIADAVERVLRTVDRQRQTIAWYEREMTAMCNAVRELQAKLQTELQRRAS